LSRFGDAVALVEDSGAEISYAELARRCEAFAGSLGQGRQLILLQAANDVDSVVAYLAALAAGHVVILAGDTDHGSEARIVRAFSPNVICKRGKVTHVADAPSSSLHPDLALLLPTSGSTGSPRLVRLSRRNLVANAEAIAEYLAITAQDRAISSLPFHYSYGMSVLNSHLQAGASVILTDMSVTNPDFWDLFRSKRATSIAGVPHSYELFERIGLRDDPPESLRVMTQAGGRLAPELIRTYAAFGAANGVRFYAMYGQTEAAPRMAYLPPDLAERNPDCIGLAIPGGSLSLEDESGNEITQAGVRGELVYRGPNVMMGYAHGRADLGREPEIEALRTGDLALRTKKGLYQIAGRASRFVKIAGLRVGLDDLEAMLAETGRETFVVGSDEAVSICLVGDEDPAIVREFVAQRCGLPIVRVNAFAVDEPPRLPSGKVDYSAVRKMGETRARRAISSLNGAGVIAAAYAKALGIAPPSQEATFAQLGGDSLSYLDAAMGVERALGQLPLRWETMPIASLEAMAPSGKPAASEWSWISSEFALRVGALTLIIAGHAVPGYGWVLQGGTSILLALAGFSLIRLQGDALRSGSIKPVLRSTLHHIILPYILFVSVALLLWPEDASINSLWMSSVFTVKTFNPLRVYWFAETLFHIILVTCTLFLLRPVRIFSKSRPFGFALLLIASSTALMYVAPFVWNDGFPDHYTFDAWLYVYYLGWGAYVAKRPWQKVLMVALAAMVGLLQYGFPSSRDFWLTVGLGVVLFVPRLKLPNLVNSLILKVAAASYFIFLVHAFAFKLLDSYGGKIQSPVLRIALLWGVSVIAGLTVARIWNPMLRRVRESTWRVSDGLRVLRPRTA
jgi:acyl-CoA synthetase (AMP-forming)/AMP-acid ligase II